MTSRRRTAAWGTFLVIGGPAYRVLSQAVHRATLLEKPADDTAFKRMPAIKTPDPFYLPGRLP